MIAYDGRVGLTAILKRIPDLVLCDVGLPDISGFELLASLNELVPPISRVPFVFLTGLSGRYDELQGRSLGADDYVTKPIDFDILETIIRARLFGGVARHEIPANLPKLNGHHVEARPRGREARPAPERRCGENCRADRRADRRFSPRQSRTRAWDVNADGKTRPRQRWGGSSSDRSLASWGGWNASDGRIAGA